MVKITNGEVVFEVTRGAFDGIYSRQGYTIIDDKAKADNQDANGSENPEKTKDDLFVEEILEKPISQWSNKEVKRFATIKEIDISGTKNADEAKEIIKAFLEENE